MNREEAINVVRCNWPEGRHQLSEALRTLIPELQESEDEIHRKWILEYLYDGLRKADEQFKDHFKAAIDWLERQKEYIDDIRQYAYNKGLVDAEEKQKPVKLNDDTELGLDRALQVIKDAKGNLRGYQSDDGIYECDHAIQTLERILKNGIEQKSAEWSEEDERMYKAISIALTRPDAKAYLRSWYKTPEDADAWLKSLRPQPEQEVVDRTVFDRIADILRWCDLPIGCPVEDFKQSESEREHLLEIVQCVAHRYANSCTYCKEYSRGYQDGLAVHHWRPSKEQVEWLESAVRLSTDKPHIHGIIISLYEQLKRIL